MAAVSRAKQAARRLNPRLETEIENIAGSGGLEGFRSAESTLAVAQEIELGGKRRYRTAAAEAEAAVSRASQEARRSELLFDTRRAVLSVLAAQSKVLLAEETLALVRETEAVARVREQSGKTTVMETGRASAETALALIELQDRLAEQRDAVRELALYWGECEPSFDAVAGSLDAPSADLPPLESLLLQATASPALLATDAQTRALEAIIQTEKAARLPNIEFAAGIRHFEESGDFGFVAGLGVELPLVNRNRDAVRAAQAEAEAARLEAAAARLKNENLLRRLHARLKTLAAKGASLRGTVIPSSERALALVKQAHEQGKAGYLDVLEARRSVAETRLTAINAATEYHACRIAMDRICPTAATR